MTYFIPILIVAIILVFLISSGSLSRQPNRRRKKNSGTATTSAKFVYEGSPPSGVGLLVHAPLWELASQLERAFAEGEFAERLKYRVLQRHSNMTTAEYEWVFVELKRYFLMTAVLQQVPMFSRRVDDIWHEMLLYTREYQQFCEQFIGYPIHHTPHNEPAAMLEERAWFDWVYAQLFEPWPYSSRIWNGFFRGPMGKEKLGDLELLSSEALQARLFNSKAAELHQDVRTTIQMLIMNAKKQIEQAYRNKQKLEGHSNASLQAKADGFLGQGFSSWAGAMLLFSVMDSVDYHGQMSSYLELERQQNANGEGGSIPSWMDTTTGGSADYPDSNRDYYDSNGNSGLNDSGSGHSGGSSDSGSGGGGGD
ncbi:glycine-rich domain-containing protein [Paenibacillus koleovorans]|uniref:glycine-rich domain-containing protein n=1 Tax=Paenibacillus koleovorans TaxID=121608 RepID=UPI000FD73207|nr:hypothetical protein [Paenibacillus koleovorans]